MSYISVCLTWKIFYLHIYNILYNSFILQAYAQINVRTEHYLLSSYSFEITKFTLSLKCEYCFHLKPFSSLMGMNIFWQMLILQ